MLEDALTQLMRSDPALLSDDDLARAALDDLLRHFRRSTSAMLPASTIISLARPERPPMPRT